jgi:hypothetical protein
MWTESAGAPLATYRNGPWSVSDIAVDDAAPAKTSGAIDTLFNTDPSLIPSSHGAGNPLAAAFDEGDLPGRGVRAGCVLCTSGFNGAAWRPPGFPGPSAALNQQFAVWRLH